MANIAELLDKLKDARQTVELVDACCMRVCTDTKHFGCPYGDEGVRDCAERLQEAYEDTVENLLQLAEALVSGAAVYGGYISSVEDAAEAKRELAKQAAQCVERVMIDNDIFTVDGDTVRWKLLLYGGGGANGSSHEAV